MPERKEVLDACRCGIPDWRTLRRALTLTQVQLAEVLALSRSGVRNLERPPHRCPRRATLRALELYLQTDHAQAALARAAYPNPFASARPPTVPLPRGPEAPGGDVAEEPSPTWLQLAEALRSLG